jgi:hypothetical protein
MLRRALLIIFGKGDLYREKVLVRLLKKMACGKERNEFIEVCKGVI